MFSNWNSPLIFEQLCDYSPIYIEIEMNAVKRIFVMIYQKDLFNTKINLIILTLQHAYVHKSECVSLHIEFSILDPMSSHI